MAHIPSSAGPVYDQRCTTEERRLLDALRAIGLEPGEVAKLVADTSHTIEFRDDGWTIAHPLRERLDGSLFDCPAIWSDDDPGFRGRFTLRDDGTLDDGDQEPTRGVETRDFSDEDGST